MIDADGYERGDKPEGDPSVGWIEALGEYANNPEQLRTTGWPIHALGSEWTVRVASLESRIKAQIEQMVRGKALEAISKVAGADPDEADRMRSVFIDDYELGEYSWQQEGLGGGKIRKFINTPYGMRAVLHLLISRCHKDVTIGQVMEMMKESPLDCMAAYRWAMGNLFAPESAATTGAAANGKAKAIPTATFSDP